jgi:hypothetical protein
MEDDPVWVCSLNGERRYSYRILVLKPNGNGHPEHLRISGKKVLKRI